MLAARKHVLEKLIAELQDYMLTDPHGGQKEQPHAMKKVVESAMSEGSPEEEDLESAEEEASEPAEEGDSEAAQSVLKKHFGSGANFKPMREQMTVVVGRSAPKRVGGRFVKKG